MIDRTDWFTLRASRDRWRENGTGPYDRLPSIRAAQYKRPP